MAATTLSIDDDVRADLQTFGKAWWLFLVAGIAWLVVSFAILSFDMTSVVLIGVGVGVVLLLATVEEAVAMITMDGWRWVHGLLAVLFFLGALFAMAYPGQTFGTLAILIGWFLLIKGTATTVLSIMSRDLPFWWLGLIAGLLTIAIGFWAVGYPGRSAALLIVWVGFGALFRGIFDIVMAFQVRHLKKELAA